MKDAFLEEFDLAMATWIAAHLDKHFPQLGPVARQALGLQLAAAYIAGAKDGSNRMHKSTIALIDSAMGTNAKAKVADAEDTPNQ